MTNPSKDIAGSELREQIIEWIDAITCDVHTVRSDYEYCADQILKLIASHDIEKKQQLLGALPKKFERFGHDEWPFVG